MKNFSRREFLAMSLGGIGVTAACACGGLGIAAWLLNDQTSSIHPPTYPTSSANRQAVNISIDRPSIVPRSEWGALEPNHQAENENGFFSETNIEGWRVYDPDIRDIYKTLVVHHSVIDEGEDLATLIEIQNLHRNEREWADVAYHFFIGKGGTVYEGRIIEARGTHVGGYNTGSLGICLLGNYMEESPNAEQIIALREMTTWLKLRLQLTHVAGHRDFNSVTVCPGDNLASKLTDLATATGLTFGTDGYETPSTSHKTDLCCCCHI